MPEEAVKAGTFRQVHGYERFRGKLPNACNGTPLDGASCSARTSWPKEPVSALYDSMAQ